MLLNGSWGSSQLADKRPANRLKYPTNSASPQLPATTTTDTILGTSPSKRTLNADYCNNAGKRNFVSKENDPTGSPLSKRTDLLKKRALSIPSIASLSQTTTGTNHDEVNTQLESVPDYIKPIFKDHVVYLASCLNLRSTLAAALVSSVKRAEGQCSVGDKLDRASMRRKLLEADIVICDRRAGWEFWTVSVRCLVTRTVISDTCGKAMDAGKTIGNIVWLLHVLRISRYEHPRERLLHFPYPPKPIPGFEKYVRHTVNLPCTRVSLVR
jgi:hypothetical protein